LKAISEMCSFRKWQENLRKTVTVLSGF